MLRIQMFGPLSVHVDGSDAASSGATHISGRPGSLFALLALTPGRYFSRTELVATMWADQADEVGSGTVNTVLWRLRKLMERPPIANRGLIASDRRGAVGLDPKQVTLDVHEFARLVQPALAKSLDRTTEADAEALRQGIDLYRADLLSDMNDEWVLREREKHRRQYLNALGRMMQISSLARDYASAIRFAQAILDQDALREEAHRELMRLFLLNGQRALALRQFEICRSILKRELAIQPMPETMALYQGIADDAISMENAAIRHPLQQPDYGLRRLDPGVAADLSQHSPRHLVESALQDLKRADAQLQMSLSFL